MVVLPAPHVLQETLRNGVLTIRCSELILNRFYVPTMNTLVVRSPPAGSLCILSQPELEQQGISPRWKPKIDFSFHLQPPNLLKVCNCMKSGQ
ncbi:hypothetical protein Hanom_Chr06g00490581 [Helianthus anomalus]